MILINFVVGIKYKLIKVCYICDIVVYIYVFMNSIEMKIVLYEKNNLYKGIEQKYVFIVYFG